LRQLQAMPSVVLVDNLSTVCINIFSWLATLRARAGGRIIRADAPSAFASKGEGFWTP
jgi:hypothetical protein